MNNDWRPGDTAVALVDGTASSLKRGAKYTVIGVMNNYRRWSGGGVGPGLVLLEVKHPGNKDGQFWHGHFEKLPFHESDEFDKETIELYNKKPTKEKA